MESIFLALSSGLPVLLLHLAVTTALLAAGVFCYMATTPFHEMELVRKGNTAAGLLIMGAILALAIPQAATLASSRSVADVLVWGVVALVLQIVAFAVASRLIRGLREMIEAGNVAAACLVVGIQLSLALLNAAGMAG